MINFKFMEFTAITAGEFISLSLSVCVCVCVCVFHKPLYLYLPHGMFPLQEVAKLKL
jgi:hypothetical protein